MHTPQTSTLVEIHVGLNTIIFEILRTIDPLSWKEQQQIIYSTVNDWDTAYQSYLVKNNIQEVKFPFSSLTRVETQVAFSQWNAPLTVYESPTPTSFNVKGAVIRPVRCGFTWTLYTKDYLGLENLVDLLVLQGSETQKFSFYSDVLQQQSEFSFIFEAPYHNLIPGKEDKIRGHGAIFSLTIPIIVDCVFGVNKNQKLISEIIQDLNLAGGLITETTTTISIDGELIT